MPFVGTKRSKDLVTGQINPKVVGDLCAIAYSPMINAWRKSPRWTTIHEIIKPMVERQGELLEGRIMSLSPFKIGDGKTAATLAYEVFFGLYGLDYERKKLKENGDVY